MRGWSKTAFAAAASAFAPSSTHRIGARDVEAALSQADEESLHERREVMGDERLAARADALANESCSPGQARMLLRGGVV